MTSPILLRFQFHLPITTFIFVSFILLFALSLPSTPLYPNSAYDRFSLTIYSMPIAFQSQPSPLPFTPCQLPSNLNPLPYHLLHANCLPFSSTKQIWSDVEIGNRVSLTLILGYMLFSLVLMVFVPGKKFLGPETDKGNVPEYKDNGLVSHITMY